MIIPTLFILTMLVFLSVRFLPGDVIDAMAKDMVHFTAGSIDREALEHMLGLDVPVYVQYGRWIGDIVLHGSLGESLVSRFTVKEKIVGRLPVTIQLGAMAIVFGLLIALPVGIYSAIRQDTVTDYLGRTAASSAWQRLTSGWGGRLSREGQKYMEQAPWLALWPGLCLTITVYSFNMFGDAMRDLIDPRMRGGVGSYGAVGKRKRGFLSRLLNPFA